MKIPYAVMTEEEELCSSAVLAYHSLSESAERLATLRVGEEVGELVSAGVARLARRASSYVAKNPPESPCQDVLARLPRILELLREAAMLHLDNRKERAAWLAAKCRELSVVSQMRLEMSLAMRGVEAEAKVKIAEAEEQTKQAQEERYRLQGARDEARRMLAGNMVTKAEWKKTDDAVMAGLTDKTRRAEEGRRRMKETRETYGWNDPDLLKIYKAINWELEEQCKRGEKDNVTKAVKAVLVRPGCARNLKQLDTVRRGFYRWKERVGHRDSCQ